MTLGHLLRIARRQGKGEQAATQLGLGGSSQRQSRQPLRPPPLPPSPPAAATAGSTCAHGTWPAMAAVLGQVSSGGCAPRQLAPRQRRYATKGPPPWRKLGSEIKKEGESMCRCRVELQRWRRAVVKAGGGVLVGGGTAQLRAQAHGPMEVLGAQRSHEGGGITHAPASAPPVAAAWFPARKSSCLLLRTTECPAGASKLSAPVCPVPCWRQRADSTTRQATMAWA